MPLSSPKHSNHKSILYLSQSVRSEALFRETFGLDRRLSDAARARDFQFGFQGSFFRILYVVMYRIRVT